ncbi:hypothetical protein BDV10DRAFT_31317 [Aspergillus recurvatus]
MKRCGEELISSRSRRSCRYASQTAPAIKRPCLAQPTRELEAEDRTQGWPTDWPPRDDQRQALLPAGDQGLILQEPWPSNSKFAGDGESIRLNCCKNNASPGCSYCLCRDAKLRSSRARGKNRMQAGVGPWLRPASDLARWQGLQLTILGQGQNLPRASDIAQGICRTADQRLGAEDLADSYYSVNQASKEKRTRIVPAVDICSL